MFSGARAHPTLPACWRCVMIALATSCMFADTAAARQPPGVSTLAQARPYRHGVVPMLGGRIASSAQSSGTGSLVYQGGLGGTGVVTGAPKVYLVFWGSQWGSQSTNSRGDVTLTGDPMAMAPVLQEFMKGLGTGGETWSGVVTQYCQGVPTGAQTCPPGAAHVRYP